MKGGGGGGEGGRMVRWKDEWLVAKYTPARQEAHKTHTNITKIFELVRFLETSVWSEAVVEWGRRCGGVGKEV